MRTTRVTSFLLVAIAALVASGLTIGCGSGSADSPPPLMRPPGATSTMPGKDVTITIGNLSDLTGVAANGMAPINMAMNDLVRYYNENGLIPGVKLEVVTYDGQYDPSRDIPGYEWLRQKGADFIFTSVPPSISTLKPRVDADRMVLFTVSSNLDELMPAGYAFSVASIPQYEAPTMMKWLAEKDPDFPVGRPAKIGGAAWTDGYAKSWFDTAEAYADAHPDQFKWVGGHFTNFSFVWDAEAEALRDCDYVFTPTPMTQFVRQYRDAGYTHAKFIGGDPHIAFLDMLDDADLWDEVDGMLIVRSYRWWNEEGPMMDLTKQLLFENHPAEAEKIKGTGVAYLSVLPLSVVFELVRETVEAVGAEGFNSDSLYDVAQSFSIEIDGSKHSFSETKRASTDAFAIYELSAADRDLVRADPAWLSIVPVR